jgi:GTPase SAR1 family protein
VFDLTSKKSFDDIARYWLKEVRNFGDPDIVMLLIGNKLDLADEQNR